MLPIEIPGIGVVTVYHYLLAVVGLVSGAGWKHLTPVDNDLIPYLNGALGAVLAEWVFPGNIDWPVGVALCAYAPGILQQIGQRLERLLGR